ncbi:MAG: hypothetical protein M3M96_01310 [Candidatus Eremiobacteraeota bacterium]|nr:hypothetical protein [Candidatus Eremiobacteraeota bacterium]
MIGIELDKLAGCAGIADLCAEVRAVRDAARGAIEEILCDVDAQAGSASCTSRVRQAAAVALSTDINLEHCLPFLIADAFGVSDLRRIVAVGSTCGIYVAYAKVIDAVLDGDLDGRDIQVAIVVANRLYGRAIAEMTVAVPNSRIRAGIDAFLAHHAAPFDAFLFQSQRTEPLTVRSYEHVARNAAAFRKIVVDLLQLCGSRSEGRERLYAALDDLAVSNQLVDDFEDWERDREQGTKTLLLAMVSRRTGDGRGPDRIAECILSPDFLDEYFALVTSYYDAAASSSNAAGAPHLAAAIRQISAGVARFSELAKMSSARVTMGKVEELCL